MGKFLLRFVLTYLAAWAVVFGLTYLMYKDVLETVMLVLPVSMVIPLNVMYNPQMYAKYDVTDRQIKWVCGILIGLITLAVFLTSLLVAERSLLVSAIYALCIPAVGFLFFGLWYRMFRPVKKA